MRADSGGGSGGGGSPTQTIQKPSSGAESGSGGAASEDFKTRVNNEYQIFLHPVSRLHRLVFFAFRLGPVAVHMVKVIRISLFHPLDFGINTFLQLRTTKQSALCVL